MNASQLIDDALGRLDDPDLEPSDRADEADPELAARRERLQQALDLLLNDGDDPLPPPDLASRTLAFVEQHRQRPRLLEFARPTVPFRWADVAVAAAILIAGLLTLLPAVQRSRMEMAQAGCISNLRQVGLALEQYANTHQNYPYVSPDCPASYVGSFALLLKDSGLLEDTSALDCPCNGHDPVLAGVKDFDDLCGREAEHRGSLQHAVGADYAYNVGYRPERGRAVPVPVDLPANVPLVSDQPPHDMGTAQILEGNSPNHGGGGQNILFTGGHVKWHRNRWISDNDKDMFLNEASRPAPGLHAEDAVLHPAVFRFGK